MSSGGGVSALEAGSPMVGAFGEAEFVDAEVALEPHDLLFLYTDGLIEARRDKEFFGEERLMELLGSLHDLSVSEVIRRISDAVFDFTGGALSDDLAILALRPENEPAKDR